MLLVLSNYSCKRAREVYLASSKQDAETSSNNRKDDKLIIYNGILLYKWETDRVRCGRPKLLKAFVHPKGQE
mgnify:FL=1